MVLVEFLTSSALIVFAGTLLAKSADRLSDVFNWNKAWIGVVLLGGVTSLPELAASLTAVVAVDAPDLAVGNMLGSNNINLMIIVLLDALFRTDSITNRISAYRSHAMSAAFVIALSVIVLAEVSIAWGMPIPTVAHVSLGSIIICGVYIAGIRLLAGIRSSDGILAASPGDARVNTHALFAKLAVSIIVIAISARWLVASCESIAQQTGLGRTFVGSMFLAFVTSLPEIVVSVSALRLGSLDLAFGNIFGSNMINIFFIVPCEVFYRKGALLKSIAPNHIFVVLLGIILTTIVIIGIKVPKRKLSIGLGWDTLAMGMCFLAGTMALYWIR